jgi:hypothetical protein
MHQQQHSPEDTENIFPGMADFYGEIDGCFCFRGCGSGFGEYKIDTA